MVTAGSLAASLCSATAGGGPASVGAPAIARPVFCAAVAAERLRRRLAVLRLGEPDCGRWRDPDAVGDLEPAGSERADQPLRGRPGSRQRRPVEDHPELVTTPATHDVLLAHLGADGVS